MKNKSASCILAALFLCLLLFDGGLAIADDEPDCEIIVNPGELIQSAIDAADPGDTICVEPGTYNEDLSITKALELAGLGDDDDFNENDDQRPIIEGIATVPADQFPFAIPNIDIQANEVSIHGFIIKSPAVAADQYSSGIVLTGRGIRIYNNFFYVGTGDISQGIQTYRQDNAPENLRDISGLHIYNNRFTNLEPATGLGAYEGIFINPQSAPIDLNNISSKDVIIQRNRFSGALIRAITTQRSRTIIAKNRINTDWIAPPALSTFPRGIQLSKAGDAPPLPAADSTNHRVVKNAIYTWDAADFYTGILVRDEVTDCTILKNFVMGSVNNGLELGLSDMNIISKNFILFSGSDGLFVNGDGNLLKKNHIWRSGSSGIHMGLKSEGNVAEKNLIKKSEEFDIHDEGTDNEFIRNHCDTSDPDGLCR
jgi:hypothetical protein